MKKRFFCTFLCAFMGLHSIALAKKEPLLIYNQFPRAWKMDIEKMKEYLTEIQKMQFNCVWVNPIQEGKNNVLVERGDEYKGTNEIVKVKKSLYAMDIREIKEDDDKENGIFFSFNNKRYFSPFSQGITREKIKNYIQEAQKKGLAIMFDFVINHVAKNCDLSNNNEKFFINDPKWDDVSKFDYDRHTIDDLFNNIWKPFIDAYVEMGFNAVRIDFATGIQADMLKKCVDYMKEKGIKAIFAESLFSCNGDERPAILKPYENMFTHITNSTIFVPPYVNDVGWVKEEVGQKRNILTNIEDKNIFYKGTIGFSGSHDEGPTPIALSHNITKDELKKNEEYIKNNNDYKQGGEKKYKRNMEKIQGQITKQKMDDLERDGHLEINVKAALATSAFMSDGGWYLLSGDEYLSKIAQRPFIRSNDSPFDKDDKGFEKVKREGSKYEERIIKFIQLINTVMKKLQYDDQVIFYHADKKIDGNHLTITRHNKIHDEDRVDIIEIDLIENTIKLNGTLENAGG